MKKILLTIAFYISLSLNSFAGDAITIIYGADYKPFAWGEEGAAYGVQKDFVEEILGKRLGIKVIHETCPWARCQDLVREGLKDGFFTIPTSERALYTKTSSLPFYETHFVMHTSKNNPYIKQLKAITSLKDLEKIQSLKHIHMFGSGWHKNALKNMKYISTINDASQIPMMLKLLRVDVYIEGAEMFRYQAKKAGILDELVTFNEPSIRELGWHIFIGNKSKYQYLIPKINQILERLRASGELEKIKHQIFLKYGINPPISN
ncbi:MAG: transporter substrate-binding domain-containing protein [Oceanospirillaceae bacterium]|nr:transporter substrate-binding domain-containing protein [Oceanospirillaceae bacterium]